MGSRTRVSLPYIHAFRDRHGRQRYYFRRRFYSPAALPGKPGDPDFMLAYNAALAGLAREPIGASRNAVGSVAAAVAAYYADNGFLALAPGTRAMRRAILERFRGEYGEQPIARLEQRHLVKKLGSMKPFAARNWLKTLRGLMAFAKAAELVPADPTAGLKLAKAKAGTRHTWTEEEIAQFEAAHPIGSRPRLAMALLLYTGQRRGDVVQIGPQHLRAGKIAVRQRKTGMALLIPAHPELLAILAAHPAQHLTFLITAFGAPFSAAGFGNLFREWCDAAELPHCSAHGLRKAQCRRLAEAGCTAPQIASISGHKSLSEVQRYIEAADQARLAEMAMVKVTAAFPESEAGTRTGKPSTRIGKP